MPSIERTTIGSEEWQRAASIYVRYKVFVLERGIAKEDEFDQNDTEGRVYANLFIGEEPVSTGRFSSCRSWSSSSNPNSHSTEFSWKRLWKNDYQLFGSLCT